MHVGACEHERILIEQTLHDRRILDRNMVAQGERASRVGCSRDRDVVLDEEWQSRQGTERLAIRSFAIDLARILQGALLVDPGERVERG